MEIIALTGRTNQGKSETLNIVYQIMLFFGYTQVPGHFKVLGNPKHKDFIDILEKADVKIGIVTLGDYEKYLKDVLPGDIVQDLLKYLEAQGCEKAVCACNSNLSKAIDFINTYKNEFVNKTPAAILAEYRIKNGEDARKIYKLI